MDVKREGVAEARKKKQRILYVAGGVVFAILAIWVSRLEPAAPTVDRSTVGAAGSSRDTQIARIANTTPPAT